jgi:hypothetical protein
MSEISLNRPPVSRRDLQSVFVWGSWAALTLGLLGFALQGGAGAFPIVDDWGVMVPRLTAEVPFSFRWLWSSRNGHRLVLPKLTVEALLTAGVEDLRWFTILNGLLWAVTAGLWLRAATKCRGRASWSDVLLSLLFLSPGLMGCLYDNISLQGSLSNLMLAIIALIYSEGGREYSLACAIVVAAALIALPLCGGNGTIPAFLLNPLLIILAWSGGDSKRRWPSRVLTVGGVLSLAVAAATLLVPLDNEKPLRIGDAELISSLRTFLECISMSIGSGGIPGGFSPSISLALLVLLSSGVVSLFALRSADDQGKRRAAFFLGLILCGFSLAAVVGLTRSGTWTGSGLTSFYALYMTSPTAAAYLAWVNLPLRRPSRIGSLVFLGIMSVAFLQNCRVGRWQAQNYRPVVDGFRETLGSGTDCIGAAAQCSPVICFDQCNLIERLDRLRELGIHPYRQLTPRRITNVIGLDPVNVVPSPDSDGCWTLEADQVLTIRPASKRRVASLTLKYQFEGPPRRVGWFRAKWSKEGVPKGQFGHRILVSGGSRELCLAIDDEIDAIALQVDDLPCRFTLEGIVVRENADQR